MKFISNVLFILLFSSIYYLSAQNRITSEENLFIDEAPKSSKVISQKKIKDFDAIEWKLANGITVFLKPTKFDNGKINFMAYSPGGTSTISDSDYIAGITADNLVLQSTPGSFNQDSFKKALKGKLINLKIFITEISSGMNGVSSTNDLQTLLELIYAYFTKPKIDSSVFLAQKQKLENVLKERLTNPAAAFQDSLSSILSNHNMRKQPWTLDVLNKMNSEKSLSVFKKLFSNPSNFIFTFVGDFNPVKIKPMVEKYIGGLRTFSGKSVWKDLNIEQPTGVIKKEIYKGEESAVKVGIVFTGPIDWNLQNVFELGALRDYLDKKLSRIMKIGKFSPYRLYIGNYAQKFPKEKYSFSITFDWEPLKIDSLSNEVFQEIDKVKNNIIDDSIFTSIKLSEKKNFENNLKSNDYWVTTLFQYSFLNIKPSDFLKEKDRIDKLSKTTLAEAAKKYLNEKNYVEVILLPEKKNNN
jgi:zinc protease